MKSYCKIGLTATLIREDNKIEDLNYMIGPKLYEENWLDLVNEGYLARPYCVEIRCQMPPAFLKAYHDEKKNFF
jgi:DNA excision repair protein ERCC-3